MKTEGRGHGKPYIECVGILGGTRNLDGLSKDRHLSFLANVSSLDLGVLLLIKQAS